MAREPRPGERQGHQPQGAEHSEVTDRAVWKSTIWIAAAIVVAAIVTFFVLDDFSAPDGEETAEGEPALSATTVESETEGSPDPSDTITD